MRDRVDVDAHEPPPRTDGVQSQFDGDQSVSIHHRGERMEADVAS